MNDAEWWKEHYASKDRRALLHELHKVFRLSYGRLEDGTWAVLSEYPDWRLQPFLELVAELSQKEIAERADEIGVTRQSKLIGGPFDGSAVHPSREAETFCLKMGRARWAVYERKRGEIPARFLGYAKSEAKGKRHEIVKSS